MKVEINLNGQPENATENTSGNVQQLPSCDVAIDIGQVLAANQALLKNMARKMEAMENKLHTMENAFNEQARLLLAERNVTLMLNAPIKEVKPWEPDTRELSPDHEKNFSFFDRVFRPWVMRRKSN